MRSGRQCPVRLRAPLCFLKLLFSLFPSTRGSCIWYFIYLEKRENKGLTEHEGTLLGQLEHETAVTHARATHAAWVTFMLAVIGRLVK